MFPKLMYKLHLVLLLAFLASGCSQVVRVSHSDMKPDSDLAGLNDGIKTKVLIQPPAVGNQQKHGQGGLLIVGPAMIWDVDLNASLPDAVKYAASKTYDDVIIGHSCDDCGLVVRPKINQVEVEKLSMRATVELELGFFDAYGREITTIQAGGDSAYIDGKRVGVGVVGYFVPLFGTAMGTHLVKQTVRDAFDAALIEINKQLSYEANSGVLARSWFPKGSSGKYAPGKHQYTAEQVARNAGCNLNSDAIKLVEEQYYTETYAASCWGKPQFSVICEFGRCQIDDEQGLAHNP